MKKLFSLFLVTLFLLCTACAEAPAYPVFNWERDAAEHWQLDETGNPINRGAHSIDDSFLCTVCGSELLDWEDGCIDVTNYDEYGNIIRYTGYENGVPTYDIAHVLTLNADGVVLTDYEFVNGVLYGETIYTVTEAGEQLCVTQTAWNDDGTTSVNYHDEVGNMVRSAIFEADGSVSFEELIEYALDEDGWYYEVKLTSRFSSGVTFVTENNQYRDPVRIYHTDEEGNITVDWTHEYCYEDGRKVWDKQYLFGVPTWEEYFHEDGYLETDIEFLEDGGKIVSTYDEDGNKRHAVTYDAKGNLVSEEYFEIEDDAWDDEE